MDNGQMLALLALMAVLAGFWVGWEIWGKPPEGCTPTDARMLRQFNHLLAQESHELQDVLEDLLRQVKTFVAREGEADFETGPATDMLRRLRPGIDTCETQRNIGQPKLVTPA